MNYSFHFLLALTCFGHGAWAASAPIPNPEPPEMDAEIAAKFYKEKSRTGNLADGMRQGRVPGGSVGAGGGCSININSNNQKNSNSGIREMFGRQNTTIITGPVINNSNCR